MTEDSEREDIVILLRGIRRSFQGLLDEGRPGLKLANVQGGIDALDYAIRAIQDGRHMLPDVQQELRAALSE